jgi:hypothetical protein
VRQALAIALILLMLAPTAHAAWSEETSRLQPGTTRAATGFDGTIVHLIGGLEAGATPTDRILRHEPQGGDVSVSPLSLPEPLAESAAVWTGKEFLVFGGRGPNGTSNRVIRIEPAAQSVGYVNTTMPQARAGMAAVWTGSVVVLIGGSPCAPCRVWEYEPVGRNWTQTATIPGLASAAATWDGKVVTVFGGRVGGRAVYRYEPNFDAWAAFAELPSARWGGGAVFDGASHYLLAGFEETSSGAEPAARALRLDGQGQLTVIDPPSRITGDASVVLAEGRIWLYGLGGSHDRILAFDPSVAYPHHENPWCDLLAILRCPRPAVAAAFPWFPVAAGLMLAVYLALAAWPARQARPGMVPRRVQWTLGIALVLAFVAQALPWARYTIGDTHAAATPWRLSVDGAGWTWPQAEALPQAELLTWSSLAGILGWLAAAGALLLFALRKNGLWLGIAAGTLAAAGWTGTALGLHGLGEGATFRWQAGIVVGVFAVVPWTVGLLVLARGARVQRDDASSPSAEAPASSQPTEVSTSEATNSASPAMPASTPAPVKAEGSEEPGGASSSKRTPQSTKAPQRKTPDRTK